MPYSPLSYSPEQTRYEHPRIVATAKDLFRLRGLEAVTLADIAFSLRMPLGAIERHFPAGKPALVQAALQDHLRDIQQHLLQQQQESTNAVEELLVLRRFTQQRLGDAGVLVFAELAAHYPVSWRYLRSVRTQFMRQYLQANLRRGIGEGLYRPGLDAAALSQQWLQQVSDQQAAAHTPAELLTARNAQLTQFLAGITSPLGTYVAQRLQEAPPYY